MFNLAKLTPDEMPDTLTVNLQHASPRRNPPMNTAPTHFHLRRRVLLGLPVLLVALGVAIPTHAADQPNKTEAREARPNFVLCIADDVSVDDFGCYGHPTIQTPNIDRLAADGLRFENAYLTISSCSPTRTSIITGRYPHNTGAPELHMKRSPHLGQLPQFPHELRKAGYYTTHVGKWHYNGDVTKSFDSRTNSYPSGGEKLVPALQQRPKDKPFFLWFGSHDAHRGWDMPLKQGPHDADDVQVPPYHVDGEKTRVDLAQYYNEVHRFDANIGRVVDELKRQGVYENTVVMVIADNGRPFPRDKTWLYDSGIRTPLVIHWPAGIAKPAVVKSLASVLDLGPTILQAADVDRPASLQGVSLLPLIEDPSAKVRDFVFAERNWHTQRHHERLVRHGDYIYIRNNLPELVGLNIAHYAKDRKGKYGGKPRAYSELIDHWRAGKANKAQEDVVRQPRPKEMLFDVTDDPHQLENLADDPRYAEKLHLLRAALDQWAEQTGDTIPCFEDMTPDRPSREDWEARIGSGRPGGGEIPGETTEAWTINHPGPVHTKDVAQ